MHILLLWTTVLLTAVSVLVLLLFKRVWYPWRCWCRHVPFHISSLPTVCALFESFRRGSCNHRIQSSPLVSCRAVLCCAVLLRVDVADLFLQDESREPGDRRSVPRHHTGLGRGVSSSAGELLAVPLTVLLLLQLLLLSSCDYLLASRFCSGAACLGIGAVMLSF